MPTIFESNSFLDSEPEQDRNKTESSITTNFIAIILNKKRHNNCALNLLITIKI